MDLQGKIIMVLPERSGTGARGEWKARDFVMETIEQYPRKMVFSVWGADRLSRFNIQQGQDVHVFFDIDAREYNGNWYNSIRAYDVRPFDPTAGTPPQAAGQATQPFPPAQATPAQPAAAPAQPAAAPAQPAVAPAQPAVAQPAAPLAAPTTNVASAIPAADVTAGAEENLDDLPF